MIQNVKNLFSVETKLDVKTFIFSVSHFFNRRKSRNFGKYPEGVNLIGPIASNFGLSESTRLVAGTLVRSEIPFMIKNVTFEGTTDCENVDLYSQYISEDLKYNVNIVHVNPIEIIRMNFLKREILDNRYNIAYWLWELPEFPRKWAAAMAPFDEIWTPAEFVSEAIRKVTNKPVRTVPYYMPMPETDKTYDRAYFGLPEDQFLYMISYDGMSNTGRKNPKASLDAFCRAFPEARGDVGLVIKVLHCGEREQKLFEELKSRYGNVYIVDRPLEKVEFNSLIKAVDAYISLHRAEGFGLVLAEAMFLGTAVVATNYSANTEFMQSDDSCLVSADEVEITEDNFPYKKGRHWAEPDIDEAAGYIRRLCKDKEYYSKIVEKAASDIAEKMGKNRIELPELNLTNTHA